MIKTQPQLNLENAAAAYVRLALVNQCKEDLKRGLGFVKDTHGIQGEFENSFMFTTRAGNKLKVTAEVV